MLKLNASFSKKCPIPGQQYSSEGYMASVEVELPDGLSEDQLKEKIHQTFQLVQSSVEVELGNAVPQTIPIQQPSQSSKSVQASNKQIKFLLDIAQRKDINLGPYLQQYQVSSVYDLNKGSCSKLIDQISKAA